MTTAELRTPAFGGHAVVVLRGELDTTGAETTAGAVAALAAGAQQLVPITVTEPLRPIAARCGPGIVVQDDQGERQLEGPAEARDGGWSSYGRGRKFSF